jgi:hypothetical protein
MHSRDEGLKNFSWKLVELLVKSSLESEQSKSGDTWEKTFAVFGGKKDKIFN